MTGAGRACIMGGRRHRMTKIEQALARLKELPPERQEEIAEMILDHAAQDDYELTPDQLEELDRRLADPNPKLLTSEEVRERLKRFGV